MTNDLFGHPETVAPVPVGSWVYRLATAAALLTVVSFVLFGHGSF